MNQLYIKRITNKQLEVLAMIEEGLSIREIATLLDITYEAVEMRIKRSKK